MLAGMKCLKHAGVKNVISILFRASATLHQNEIFIISGLNGPIDVSEKKTGSDQDVWNNARNVFTARGWNMGFFKKVLKIYVAAKIVEQSPCTFEFEVTNPHHGQYPPEISIESRGSTSLPISKLRYYSYDPVHN
jgi:hypothetical protein